MSIGRTVSGAGAPEEVFYSIFESGRWRIGVAVSSSGTLMVEFPLESIWGFLDELSDRFGPISIIESNEKTSEPRDQIRRYLDGTRKRFNTPIDLRCMDFQRLVLEETCRIPFGKTASYGEIARRIGNPRSARAVGAALNANPIPLIIPCHRVIGSDGSLVGFGGGIRTKKLLLDHESAG